MAKNDSEMAERMARLETDVVYIKQSIDRQNEYMVRTESKIDSFICGLDDKLDRKYANKAMEEKVEEHDKSINKINLTLAKWAGAVLAGTALVQIILKMVFKL